MGEGIDLDAIRQRHAQWHDDASLGMDEDEWDAYAVAVIGDRDALLAEVNRLRADNGDLWSMGQQKVDQLVEEIERLTAELDESRAAYDAVCRMIGSSLRGPE